MREALAGGGFWKTLGLVILLRLPINSPFAVTNLVMASVRIPMPTYVLGTIIGIAPRTGIVVYLAAQIQDALEEGGPAKPRFLIFGSIAIVIVAVMVIGHMANQAIAKATTLEDARESEGDEPADA